MIKKTIIVPGQTNDGWAIPSGPTCVLIVAPGLAGSDWRPSEPTGADLTPGRMSSSGLVALAVMSLAATSLAATSLVGRVEPWTSPGKTRDRAWSEWGEEVSRASSSPANAPAVPKR